jgi:hypothetical protein
MNLLRKVGLFGVICGLCSACGGSTTAPSAPTYDTYTDSFSGELFQNADINAPDFGPAGSFHHFTVHQGTSAFPAGIDVTVTALSPLSTITVGVGLTTWNATNQSCDLPLQLSSSAAKVGLTLSGSTGLPAELCVAVFDVGNVLGSTLYDVRVVHN